MTAPLTERPLPAMSCNQRFAFAISLMNSSQLVLLGVLFLGFPAIPIEPGGPTGSEDDFTGLAMSRLAGGTLLILAFAITISNCYKTALVSQGLFGIMLVGVALAVLGPWHSFRQHDDSSHARIFECLIGWGSAFIFMSSLGLILSFWPAATNNSTEEAVSEQPPPRVVSRNFCCGWTRRDRVSAIEEQLQEPLLGEEEETNQEEQITPPDDESQLQQPQTRIQGTRRLMQLAAPQMYYLYMGCLVLLIRLPFSLSIPHFVSTTLGALAREEYNKAHQEILLLFFLGTVDAMLDYWCVFLFGYAKERIIRGVRIDLFTAVLRQEVAFFDSTTSGELSSRLSSDCGAMAGDLTWFFRFSIESVVRIVGIAIYMLIRCPVLGGCALSIVPVVAVVNKLYGDWLRKNAIAVQEALAAANSTAQETFACVRTVIAFSAETYETKRYSNKIEDYYNLNIQQLIMTGAYFMVVSTFLINTAVQSALLLIGSVLIKEGKLTSEILLAFMLYQGQLQSETMNLFNSYSSLVKSSGAGDKVFSLLDRQPPPPGTGNSQVVVSDETQEDEPARESSKHSSSGVRLSNVNFSYPSRPAHRVLRGLNLTIPAGSTTALVGPSGCGKSTLIGLLKRFYDPTDGSIYIDDKDLRDMDVKAHRRNVGVVTQDPILFTGSIMDNITYGADDISTEDAMKAAKQSNAHAFVTSFPQGYDTPCGERGVQLSGGQKQRIAIARAISKKVSLLLLDEATSALDADSETVVQEALDKLLNLRKHMTTVIVAHRLRTVRNADNIAYIHEGKVAEQGTHYELMKKKDGLYRKMVKRAGPSGKLPE